MSALLPAPLRDLNLESRATPLDMFLVRTDGISSVDDPYDFDAPYQRGSVWTVEQRVALVESLLLGVPVGAVTIAQLPYDRERCYRVIDGKQRILAVRAFHEGVFWTPGWWWESVDLVGGDPARHGRVRYADLTFRGQRVFARCMLPTLLYKHRQGQSEERMLRDEARVFGLINSGGTAQSDEDLARAAAIAGGAS